MMEDQNSEISAFEIPQEMDISDNFENTELGQLYVVLVKQSSVLEKTLNLQDDEVRILEEQKIILKQDSLVEKSEMENLKIELRELKNVYQENSDKLNDLNKVIDKIDNSRNNTDRWEKLVNEAESILFESAEVQVDDISNSEFYFEKNNEILANNPCKLIFNDFDPEIKKHRIETEPSFFFAYTHPKLKPHFKEKNFIECHGSISKISGTYYLQLSLKLASKDAARNYGQIERNSLIRFQMIDGEKRYLSNIYPDAGMIEQYTGNTIYRAVFPIDKDYLKLFKTVELDHLGIIWTTGYEQYNIYEVDFLMNHLKCIEGE